MEKPAWHDAILLPVFIPAVAVIFLLVLGTISNPALAGELFATALSFITRNFGWFYMLSVAIFLFFLFLVGLSN